MAFQRELHPGGISKPSLGVNDVEKIEGVVDRDQHQDEECPPCGGPSPLTIHRPDGPGHSHAGTREKHRVRPAQPIEQRNNGQASQGASRQIGGVKRGNVVGLARKDNGEFQAGDKNGTAEAR